MFLTCLFFLHALTLLLQHLNVNQIQVVVRRCSSPNVTEETTYFIPRNPLVDAGTNTDPPVVCCPLLHRFCPCPPRGLLASLITKGDKTFSFFKPRSKKAMSMRVQVYHSVVINKYSNVSIVKHTKSYIPIKLESNYPNLSLHSFVY